MMNSDAALLIPGVPGPYDTTGVGYSAAAARLSFLLDLRGPALVVDTACSGALVALHLASRELDAAPEAAALAGTLVDASLSRVFARGGLLSPRGRCHAFDGRADGYCRGEGCGSVMLQRDVGD